MNTSPWRGLGEEWATAKGRYTVLRYLNDRIAELQGIHELDEGGQQEPVVLQEAVPLLAFLFQLRGQGGVQPTEASCKHLCLK